MINVKRLASYNVPVEFWEMQTPYTYITGDFTSRGRRKIESKPKKDFEIIPGVTVGLYYKEKLKKANFNKYKF